MVVHKRTEQWDGLPFSTLGEVAELIAELGSKLGSLDEVQASASVTTEEQDFRDLTLDELQELSKALPIDEMQSLTASCERGGKQGFLVNLVLFNDTKSITQLDVEGEEEVVVDGLHVGAKKKIDGRFEKIRQAERLAEVKSNPHENDKSSVESRMERWMIQIVGGAVAAVLAAGIIFLLSH